MTTGVDLNLARNVRGPLDGTLRARLTAAIGQPGEATWDAAYSIILNPDVGFGLSLWQAVCALDSSYASVGPVTEDGKRGPWGKVPPAGLIVQAINYATH